MSDGTPSYRISSPSTGTRCARCEHLAVLVVDGTPHCDDCWLDHPAAALVPSGFNGVLAIDRLSLLDHVQWTYGDDDPAYRRFHDGVLALPARIVNDALDAAMPVTLVREQHQACDRAARALATAHGLPFPD